MSGNLRLPSGNGGNSPPHHRSREERARRFNSSLEAAALAVNEEKNTHPHEWAANTNNTRRDPMRAVSVCGGKCKLDERSCCNPDLSTEELSALYNFASGRSKSILVRTEFIGLPDTLYTKTSKLPGRAAIMSNRNSHVRVYRRNILYGS